MSHLIIQDEPTLIRVWAKNLESQAELQIRRTARLPFVFKHVAVMPDAHAGKGSTIGTVLATKDAIIPAAVGVDIGCGMTAVRLPVSIDAFTSSLKAIRESIENLIPTGMDANKEVTSEAEELYQSLGPTSAESKKAFNEQVALHQLGSLGSGNHFIEICYDQENMAWVMLHSGSRGIGNRLAVYHIDRAKDLARAGFENLEDPDLSCFFQGTDPFKAYIHDLEWSQTYAKHNRQEMMRRVLKMLTKHVRQKESFETDHLLKIDCHHNYCQTEQHFGENVWVTRKGAVSARSGEWGIIPGSMGARSFIVKGLGQAASFQSCAHGAGRLMSRSQARSQFTKADFIKATEGVECRKDIGLLDEIPMCYKDIDEVMEQQKDLVEAVFTLKQVVCVKGN